MADFKKTIAAMVAQGLDYTPRQIAMLQHLFVKAAKDSDRYVRSVAEAMQVAKPVVTRCADKLQSEGLLVRTVPAHDRRLMVLTLTFKGAEFVKKMNAGFPA